ncbi:MAG: hypothetical protein BWY78_00887 [Alphaproteobacteria bacterium ADurb.Bin438]|nr:MAG: hypothetical protein BWY78_00887 [Alphaproteobacteria bacterium ADurb.Bin438]
MKKFKAGRFDLMAASDNFLTGVKNAPLSYDDLEIAFVLNESSMYYAFSKTTDDETVNEYQKAFDEVNAEGKVQAIKDSYLK